MEAVKPTVSVGISFTYNLGDYNSIKIDMRCDGIELKDGETPPRALDRVYDMLDRKIEDKINRAVKEFSG